MKNSKSLPPGREHELLFGLTVDQYEDKKAPDIPELDFYEAMRQVVKTELFFDDEPDKVYNPANPNWGEASARLFRAVRKHLPRRPKNSLRLYLANKTSLDIHHQTDVFFLWKNVHCTIDLSLRNKWSSRSNHLLIDLRDMDDEAFDVCGKQIADILKDERQSAKTNPGKLFFADDSD